MVVTGTNGKTTTTSMLASIMQHAGYQAEAVGNIGVSVAEAISAPQRIDVLVAELSSFQLHWSSQLVPDVGVLLNLAEDHIDWHGSMAAYAAAKAKVLAAPLAIAGLDDALVQQYITTSVMGFTMHPPQVGQVGVTNGTIVDNLHGTTRNIVPAAGLEPPGPAGIYDALAATAAAVALVPDLQPSVIAQALQTFKVAGHRGQQVAEARGIVAIDNSKATNPHAADSAWEWTEISFGKASKSMRRVCPSLLPTTPTRNRPWTRCAHGQSPKLAAGMPSCSRPRRHRSTCTPAWGSGASSLRNRFLPT